MIHERWRWHLLENFRTRKKIADVEMAISWVLKPQHRTRILFQRIRPWLNAQKRKEDAEKKAKEEAEILKREQEALKVSQESENENLVALDVNKNELNTKSNQNKSESQNTQDDKTIQENVNKELSSETVKEENQSKESSSELKNRTEENNVIVPNKLRNVVDKNCNVGDNVRNDSCSNSNSVSRCIYNKEDKSEVFENESSHTVNVTEDKFISKEDKNVEISSNNCGNSVQNPLSKKECKAISNRTKTGDDDSKNIKISNLVSKNEKKPNHNSMQQNRKFSTKTNKIVNTIRTRDVAKKNLQSNDKVLHENRNKNENIVKSPKVSSRSKRDGSKRDNEMINYLPKDIPLEIIAKPFSV